MRLLKRLLGMQSPSKMMIEECDMVKRYYMQKWG